MNPPIRLVLFEPGKHEESRRSRYFPEYACVYPGEPEYETTPYEMGFVERKDLISLPARLDSV